MRFELRSLRFGVQHVTEPRILVAPVIYNLAVYIE